MSLWRLSAGELLAGYRARAFAPVEVVDALAERIAARDPEVNAFVTLDLERARAAAARARTGEAARPLEGVPVAVKDLMDTAGLRTTYGAAAFAEHVPAADAEVVRRVRAAGAIVLGKTLTHEYAWGITSDNPHQGPCRNPWAPDRVAGGSSGGSAAALAYGGAPLALGSDTGGSIRIPAAFCGVVGLKPTHGRVPLDGIFPLAPTLDHAGPMARTAADARLLYGAIRDYGPPVPGAGLPPRVALCPDLHPVALSAAVRSSFDAAITALAGLGAKVEEVAAPGLRDAYATFAPIQLAEALRVHRRAGLYPARASEYGADVRRRLEFAEAVKLDEYLAAAEARERLRAAFARLFAQADVVLTPVSAGSPVRVGEDKVRHEGRELPFRELVMGYTVPQDVAGVPSCTVRAGTDEFGVPVGVQLTAAWWRETLVLDTAEALSSALDVDAVREAGRPQETA